MLINYAGILLDSEFLDVEGSIQNLLDSDETTRKSIVCVFNQISSTECTLTFTRHYDSEIMPEPGFLVGRDAFLLLGISIDKYWPSFMWPEPDDEEQRQNGQYTIPMELYSYVYKKACEEVHGDVPRIVWVQTKRNMVVLKLVY